MKIGIYGGTFNPPHKGHAKVMEAVIASLELDELWLVPTKNPPHKTLPLNSPDEEDRFMMIESVGDYVGFHHGDKCPIKALDVEMARKGKSYTVETLELLREEHPDDEFWLVMGEDMLMSFYSWKSPDKICQLTNLCGFLRSDQEPTAELVEQGERLEKEFGTQVRLISLPNGMDISSTELREAMGENKLPAELMACTLGQIATYQLYGVTVNPQNLEMDMLRNVVYGFVKAKRAAHIRGVEAECVKLAKKWGVDETIAARAGILHDITKYWSHERHLEFCDQCEYPLSDLERSNEKLLHAKSGAVFSHVVLGEAREICEAIECHTTGKADMETLDKILYLADYIEVNRDFPELEKLRALAYEDLDKALAYGLEIALEEMETRGKELHPDTKSAYEQYG